MVLAIPIHAHIISLVPLNRVDAAPVKGVTLSPAPPSSGVFVRCPPKALIIISPIFCVLVVGVPAPIIIIALPAGFPLLESAPFELGSESEFDPTGLIDMEMGVPATVMMPFGVKVCPAMIMPEDEGMGVGVNVWPDIIIGVGLTSAFGA